MSSTSTPSSAFADALGSASRNSPSSAASTPSTAQRSFYLSHPRTMILSVHAIADAHTAFEQWCTASHCSAPTATVAALLSTSSDDDAWIAASTGAEASQKTREVSVFDTSIVPSISLGDFGVALVSRVPFASSELTLATLVLCRRYISATKMERSACVMHRLYAACFFIALCSHCDTMIKPSDFAQAAGLNPKEMPRLTQAVLHGLDWRTQVSRDQIETLVAACDPLL